MPSALSAWTSPPCAAASSRGERPGASCCEGWFRARRPSTSQARKAARAGADGRSLSRAIRIRGKVDPVFVEQTADLPAALPGLLRDGDVLLLMGAGDIGAMAARLSRDGLPT